jgi:hypothetical protein
MKIPSLLCLALLLSACGEPAPTAPSAGGGEASSVAPPTLVARSEPLATGDVAPAFDGLPAGGKTVLVFYRGPW